MRVEPDDPTTTLGRGTTASVEYGRVLAGELDRDDPASVAAFRVAVGPIDELRAANRRSRVTSVVDDEDPGPEFEEPLPAVDPAPDVEPPTT